MDVPGGGASARVVIRVDVDDAEARAKLAALGRQLKDLDGTRGRGRGGGRGGASGQLDELSDSTRKFSKSVKDADNDMNRFQRFWKDFKKDGNFTGVKMLKGMFSGLFKVIKYGAIELAVMTAAFGALELAMWTGKVVAKGWQAALRGIGAAAGVAVAGVSTVLGAIREMQVAQMEPLYTGPLTLEQDMSGLMGDKQLGMYSKALGGIAKEQMVQTGRMDARFQQRLVRLADFAMGDDKTLTAISAAFSKAQKEGKVTADVYSQLQQASPALAKAFEEMAGGEKAAAGAAAAGRIKFEDFMAAVQKGELEALKPFNGALARINDTLIGRFKGALASTKEDLTRLGDGFLGLFKDPLARAEYDIHRFIVKVTPTLQRVFPELVGNLTDGGGVLSKGLDRLATLVNTGMPKLIGFGSGLKEAWYGFKEILRDVGDYIDRMSGPFSVLYNAIIKPLGQEIVKTLNFAMEQFGALVAGNADTLRSFGNSLHGIFEGVRGVLIALGTAKKVMQPFIDGVLKIGSALGNALGGSSFLGSLLRTVVTVGLIGTAFSKVFSKIEKFTTTNKFGKIWDKYFGTKQATTAATEQAAAATNSETAALNRLSGAALHTNVALMELLQTLRAIGTHMGAAMPAPGAWAGGIAGVAAVNANMVGGQGGPSWSQQNGLWVPPQPTPRPGGSAAGQNVPPWDEMLSPDPTPTTPRPQWENPLLPDPNAPRPRPLLMFRNPFRRDRAEPAPPPLPPQPDPFAPKSPTVAVDPFAPRPDVFGGTSPSSPGTGSSYPTWDELMGRPSPSSSGASGSGTVGQWVPAPTNPPPRPADWSWNPPPGATPPPRPDDWGQVPSMPGPPPRPGSTPPQPAGSSLRDRARDRFQSGRERLGPAADTLGSWGRTAGKGAKVVGRAAGRGIKAAYRLYREDKAQRRLARQAGLDTAQGFDEGVKKRKGSLGMSLAFGLGMAGTMGGSFISGKADATSNGWQATGGALSGAGTGAMLGSALGPYGAAAGAVIGGLIGGISGWMGADKERERRRQETRDNVTGRVNEAIGSRNRESDFAGAREAIEGMKSELEMMDPKSPNSLKKKMKDLEADKYDAEVAAMSEFAKWAEGKGSGLKYATEDTRFDYAGDKYTTIAAGQFYDPKTGDVFDAENNRVEDYAHKYFAEVYQMTESQINDILGGDDDGKNASAIGRMFGSDPITKQISAYKTKLKELEEQFKDGGAAQAQILEETKKVEDEWDRYSVNVASSMAMTGKSADELADLFDSLGLSLSDAGVGVVELNKILGYTGDIDADRATAAGRLNDLLVGPLAQWKDGAEKNAAMREQLTKWFETRGEPMDLNSMVSMTSDTLTSLFDNAMAKYTSGEITWEQLMGGATVTKTTPTGTTYETETQGKMFDQLDHLLMQSYDLPPDLFNMMYMQVAALKQRVETAKDDPFERMKIDADFASKFTELTDAVKGDALVNMSQKGMTADKALELGTDQLKTFFAENGMEVTPETEAQLKNMLGSTLLNSSTAIEQAFGEGSQVAYNMIRAAITGTPITVGLLPSDRLLLRRYGGPQDTATPRGHLVELRSHTLGDTASPVRHLVETKVPSLRSHTLGDTASPVRHLVETKVPSLSFGDTTSSVRHLVDTKVPSLKSLPFGDTTSPIDNTAGPRFAQSMAVHKAVDATVPGKRSVTSGIRDFALGSINSDHTTGAAYDLVGDNLLAYGAEIRANGGFAEMHGGPANRHLHVVPGAAPTGDTSTPVVLAPRIGDGPAPVTVTQQAAPAPTVAPITVNVYGTEGQSVRALADEVMDRLERKERSIRERY